MWILVHQPVQILCFQLLPQHLDSVLAGNLLSCLLLLIKMIRNRVDDSPCWVVYHSHLCFYQGMKLHLVISLQKHKARIWFVILCILHIYCYCFTSASYLSFAVVLYWWEHKLFFSCIQNITQTMYGIIDLCVFGCVLFHNRSSYDCKSAYIKFISKLITW